MSDPHASASNAESEKPGSADESDKDKEKKKEPKRWRQASGFQTEVMSFHVGLVGIILLFVYTALFGGMTTYTLFRIWPADSVMPDTTLKAPQEPEESESKSPAPATPLSPAAPAVPRVNSVARAPECKQGDPCADTVVVFRNVPLVGRWLGFTLDFRPPHAGRRFLLIALLAGGLGAFLSSILSLADYIGERKLTRSWAVWYLARPPVGMGLALLVYFLLRGGLLTPAASVSVVSPYGVAAFSGLIGMFVRQAMDKLKEVADALFTSKVNEQRSEAVHKASPGPADNGGTGGTRGTGGTGPSTGGAGAVPPKPPARPGGAPAAPVTPEAIAGAHVQDPGA